MFRTVARAFTLVVAVLIVSGAHGQEPETMAKKEFMEAHQKMSKGMMIEYTGDVDIDFVRGMIPHHQGAVDMCKTELKYGKDAEILQLCRNIISAQEEEISVLKAWLLRREQTK